MAKSLASRTGLIGGVLLVILGILLVVGVLDLELIIGIALIVFGGLAIIENK